MLWRQGSSFTWSSSWRTVRFQSVLWIRRSRILFRTCLSPPWSPKHCSLETWNMAFLEVIPLKGVVEIRQGARYHAVTQFQWPPAFLYLHLKSFPWVHITVTWSTQVFGAPLWAKLVYLDFLWLFKSIYSFLPWERERETEREKETGTANRIFMLPYTLSLSQPAQIMGICAQHAHGGPGTWTQALSHVGPVVLLLCHCPASPLTLILLYPCPVYTHDVGRPIAELLGRKQHVEDVALVFCFHHQQPTLPVYCEVILEPSNQYTDLLKEEIGFRKWWGLDSDSFLKQNPSGRLGVTNETNPEMNKGFPDLIPSRMVQVLLDQRWLYPGSSEVCM